MPNATNIIAPRVPLTDPRTGLVHREWYNFFFSLFELTGGGQNQMSITDLMVGPPTNDVDLSALIADVLTEPTDSPLVSQLAVVAKAIQSLGVVPPVPDTMALVVALQGLQEGPADAGLTERVAELVKTVQGLQMVPVAQPGPVYLTATATLDFPDTAAGACSDLTITVPGAVDGDKVDVVVPNGSVPANGVFFGWASAADTVTIRYANNDLVTSYNPSSGLFRAVVTRF